MKPNTSSSCCRCRHISRQNATYSISPSSASYNRALLSFYRNHITISSSNQFSSFGGSIHYDSCQFGGRIRGISSGSGNMHTKGTIMRRGITSVRRKNNRAASLTHLVSCAICFRSRDACHRCEYTTRLHENGESTTPFDDAELMDRDHETTASGGTAAINHVSNSKTITSSSTQKSSNTTKPSLHTQYIRTNPNNSLYFVYYKEELCCLKEEFLDMRQHWEKERQRIWEQKHEEGELPSEGKGIPRQDSDSAIDSSLQYHSETQQQDQSTQTQHHNSYNIPNWIFAPELRHLSHSVPLLMMLSHWDTNSDASLWNQVSHDADSNSNSSSNQQQQHSFWKEVSVFVLDMDTMLSSEHKDLNQFSLRRNFLQSQLSSPSFFPEIHTIRDLKQFYASSNNHEAVLLINHNDAKQLDQLKYYSLMSSNDSMDHNRSGTTHHTLPNDSSMTHIQVLDHLLEERFEGQVHHLKQAEKRHLVQETLFIMQQLHNTDLYPEATVKLQMADRLEMTMIQMDRIFSRLRRESRTIAPCDKHTVTATTRAPSRSVQSSSHLVRLQAWLQSNGNRTPTAEEVNELITELDISRKTLHTSLSYLRDKSLLQNQSKEEQKEAIESLQAWIAEHPNVEVHLDRYMNELRDKFQLSRRLIRQVVRRQLPGVVTERKKQVIQEVLLSVDHDAETHQQTAASPSTQPDQALSPHAFLSRDRITELSKLLQLSEEQVRRIATHQKDALSRESIASSHSQEFQSAKEWVYTWIKQHKRRPTPLELNQWEEDQILRNLTRNQLHHMVSYALQKVTAPSTTFTSEKKAQLLEWKREHAPNRRRLTLLEARPLGEKFSISPKQVIDFLAYHHDKGGKFSREHQDAVLKMLRENNWERLNEQQLDYVQHSTGVNRKRIHSYISQQLEKRRKDAAESE